MSEVKQGLEPQCVQRLFPRPEVAPDPGDFDAIEKIYQHEGKIDIDVNLAWCRMSGCQAGYDPIGSVRTDSGEAMYGIGNCVIQTNNDKEKKKRAKRIKPLAEKFVNKLLDVALQDTN